MILYRKVPNLRVARAAAPTPPYWAATSIAPYGPRRATPIAIDYLGLRATAAERLEVTVTEHARDELERMRGSLDDPLLIDGADFADVVFSRGDELLHFAADRRLSAMYLTSTRGDLPEALAPEHVVTIATWPLELARLERLFADAQARGLAWGAAVPVLFPVTTSLAALDDLARLAREHGARFFTSLPIDADATAKKAMADSLALADDDETYDYLFHADLEPLHVATERHIAALAAEAGMADFVIPPAWERRSNWNGAILLTLTAARMIALGYEVETAGTLARSARVVASLDKPIERIAEAASLAIVESLDALSVDALTEWLESGKSSFVERINARWRLRRDVVR